MEVYLTKSSNCSMNTTGVGATSERVGAIDKLPLPRGQHPRVLR